MKEYYVINVLEGIYEDFVKDNDKDYMEKNNALTEAVKALSEIQQYRAIGTVEECREAMNKQAAKIPINLEYMSDDYSWEGECPCCSAYISENKKYCQICGQHLKWSKP